MNIEQFREHCLAVRGAVEAVSLQTSKMLTYKVMGKVFVYLEPEPEDGAVRAYMKCQPERSVELRERSDGINPDTFKTLMWNWITLESDVPDELIEELVRHSADEVIKKLPKKKQEEYRKEALIIIDIQNDYFEGGANPLVGSLEASLRAKALLEDFRARALPVVHIRHLSTRPGSTFFIPGTHGAEINENVAPVVGEKVIEKNFPNSFRDTDLLDYLHSEDITDIVICGMMTHMCVDATVRAAKDFGFSCTVIGDACATKDLEIGGRMVAAADVQMAFLAALSYFYATVKTSVMMPKVALE